MSRPAHRGVKKNTPDAPRVPAVYRIQGIECPHAAKGCCVDCYHAPRLFRRFKSREVMPAAR